MQSDAVCEASVNCSLSHPTQAIRTLCFFTLALKAQALPNTMYAPVTLAREGCIRRPCFSTVPGTGRAASYSQRLTRNINMVPQAASIDAAVLTPPTQTEVVSANAPSQLGSRAHAPCHLGTLTLCVRLVGPFLPSRLWVLPVWHHHDAPGPHSRCDSREHEQRPFPTSCRQAVCRSTSTAWSQ